VMTVAKSPRRTRMTRATTTNNNNNNSHSLKEHTNTGRDAWCRVPI
jgi:hypothetical protein